MINLNQRLLRVCSFLKEGTLADIGSTTHIYLFMPSKIRYVTVQLLEKSSKGPYKAALNNVAENNLGDSIEVRLGDGLAVINHDDEIDNITICGMGGPLIAKILKRRSRKISTSPKTYFTEQHPNTSFKKCINFTEL